MEEKSKKLTKLNSFINKRTTSLSEIQLVENIDNPNQQENNGHKKFRIIVKDENDKIIENENQEEVRYENDFSSENTNTDDKSLSEEKSVDLVKMEIIQHNNFKDSLLEKIKRDHRTSESMPSPRNKVKRDDGKKKKKNLNKKKKFKKQKFGFFFLEFSLLIYLSGNFQTSEPTAYRFPSLGNINIKQVAAGGNFFLLMTDQFEVFSFGDNRKFYFSFFIFYLFLFFVYYYFYIFFNIFIFIFIFILFFILFFIFYFFI